MSITDDEEEILPDQMNMVSLTHDESDAQMDSQNGFSQHSKNSVLAASSSDNNRSSYIDKESSTEAPNNRYLGKRNFKMDNYNYEQIYLEEDFRTDNKFLQRFWNHYESEKHMREETNFKSFEKFKINFLKLCEIDLFFCKKVTLLYKFVLTHRYEHMNETKMRYNKILDNNTEQPNWIYDINNPHMKPQKKLKQVGEKNKQ